MIRYNVKIELSYISISDESHKKRYIDKFEKRMNDKGFKLARTMKGTEFYSQLAGTDIEQLQMLIDNNDDIINDIKITMLGVKNGDGYVCDVCSCGKGIEVFVDERDDSFGLKGDKK